jgi:hypothetical protein
MKTLWDQFNPRIYIKENYAQIHEEDLLIIQHLARFCLSLPKISHALEIGVGPNLYPVMAKLPFIDSLECVDFSSANVDYLAGQLVKPSDNWDQFLQLFKSINPKYNLNLADTLKEKVTVRLGSIYDLEKAQFGLGSMFFCAESITDNYDEFTRACNRFIESVKTGGYLMASFMENSVSYKVGDTKFPAYPVDTAVITKIFSPKTKNLIIYRIPRSDQPVGTNHSYTGMLFLTASVR